jgi:hypothetical protein
VKEFLSEPSSMYKETVEAIRQLVKAEGLEHAERAFAEAVSTRRRKERLKGGYIHSEENQDAYAVIGTETPIRFPGDDHMSAVLKGRQPIACIAQPYHMGWETLCSLVDFCKGRGLKAEISAKHSWHFPGWTLLLAVTKEGATEILR